MSFKDLKKQSSLGSLTQKLVKEVEKMNSTSGGADERLWKPEVDKTGNGYAVLRFLPAPEGEDIPWVKLYSHAFQGPGGWYIENSLTTTGKKDPVSDHNRELWNSGNESDKDVVRKQKRKLSYYANIYVVKDSANPETEGKTYLYKFGKKIFDKITASMQPEFEDEEPINPFDFWKGANFKLKIKQVGGFWNYDSSEFGKVEALLKDDEALEKIYDGLYNLNEFTNDDQFKSYEDLKKRLDTVLGTKLPTGSLRYQDPEVADEDNHREVAAPVDEELAKLTAAATPAANTEDEDEALSYFQKLAEE